MVTAACMLYAAPVSRLSVAETPSPVLAVELHEGEPVGTPRRKRRGKANAGVFRRRAMYKHELARWYGICRKTFCARDIALVLPQLQAKGYTPRTRLLSLAMVNIICDHLDDPTESY